MATTAKKLKSAAHDAAEKGADASPNPMTNLVLTDLLLRTGGRLLRHTVEGALLQTKYDKKKAKTIVKGRSMTQTLVSTAIARVATRSVPGAIVVGGGMLAKMLYDRNQGRRAARKAGDKAVAKQAEKGEKPASV